MVAWWPTILGYLWSESAENRAKAVRACRVRSGMRGDHRICSIVFVNLVGRTGRNMEDLRLYDCFNNLHLIHRYKYISYSCFIILYHRCHRASTMSILRENVLAQARMKRARVSAAHTGRIDAMFPLVARSLN